MLHYLVDEVQAREIAIMFVQQHHSIISVARPVAQGGIWTVAIHVSSPVRKTLHVQIDATTGHVVGFEKKASAY